MPTHRTGLLVQFGQLLGRLIHFELFLANIWGASPVGESLLSCER